MKLILLSSMTAVSVMTVNHVSEHHHLFQPPAHSKSANTGIPLQPGSGQQAGKMRSIVFKSQDFCRVELKDFDFDVQFSLVSATVYFTGSNFTGVEKGYLVSSSLQPVKKLMDRCQPGSIVVFDEIKVKGPDHEIRTIDGVTYQLY